MVRIKDLPREADRVDLSKLPQEADLKALREKEIPATSEKSGGILIVYKMRDGKEFPQKYTQMHNTVLVAALSNLKIKDTEDLQKTWYHYKLTPFRIGYPRMIPVAKVK